jgi:hypothetical protein
MRAPRWNDVVDENGRISSCWMNEPGDGVHYNRENGHDRDGEG